MTAGRMSSKTNETPQRRATRDAPKRVAKRANLLAAPPNTQGPPALKGSAKTTFKAVRGAVAGA